MGCDDMWCRFPSEFEYLLEMHYMTPLQMILLRLRHMWAPILFLEFEIDVPNVVQKVGYRNVVAEICACVSNRAGPPGSWTRELEGFWFWPTKIGF